MEIEFNATIDSALQQRFEMALQLNGDDKNTIVSALLKSYVAQIFAHEAAQYNSTSAQEHHKADDYYGMALRRIPKWAKKSSQINHKIIRAYLQLSEKGVVTYNMLADYCSDKTNADVFIPTFHSNFAQMKFDGEKSHGKVFEVDENGVVTIWKHVEDCLETYKQYFVLHTTDAGYVNVHKQHNMGKTERAGTDHLQYLYRMKCGLCGHEYDANGTDIFEKKCPHCQNGARTASRTD